MRGKTKTQLVGSVIAGHHRRCHHCQQQQQQQRNSNCGVLIIIWRILLLIVATTLVGDTNNRQVVAFSIDKNSCYSGRISTSNRIRTYFHTSSTCRRFPSFIVRNAMSSSTTSNDENNDNDNDNDGPVILLIGSCGLDRLLTVSNYPAADAKVRTTSYNEVGGGNSANTASGKL